MPGNIMKLRSRPPIARMMLIHERLKENKYPNCNNLSKEAEVVPRTIARDILFMKYRLNLPIEYDKQRHGYYYSEPVKNFPTINLSESELFSLLVAQKAIAQYKGTRFQKPLDTAFKKIVGILSDNIYYCVRNIEKAVTFRPFAPEQTDEEKFTLINKAIQKCVVISFEYRKLAASKTEARNVRPYCLVCADNHWYLIGFDEGRGQIRTFSLQRMGMPTITEKNFKRPKDFDVEEYLKGSLSIFKGTADYEIVIELDRWGTDLIKGKILHESQQITPTTNGGSRLSLRLNSIEEIESWVLSMGEHATVIKPKVLIDRIGEKVGIIAKMYGFEISKGMKEKVVTAQKLPGIY
ncbi:MAG: helix-turn-helix transcriptional regulator [Verrucomicrobiia bacterium]